METGGGSSERGGETGSEGVGGCSDEAHEPKGEAVVFGKKELYREQLKRAIQRVAECLREGTPKKRIVEVLNEEGFKTRTGRKWTYSILNTELRRLEAEGNS